MKNIVSCSLLLSLAVFPATVLAGKHHDKHYYKHHHHHHNPHKVVIVNEHHHHHHSYHKSRLPEIATFAVIAGVTYAIIDNTFYKKNGDEYHYVERP